MTSQCMLTAGNNCPAISPRKGFMIPSMIDIICEGILNDGREGVEDNFGFEGKINR